MKLFYDLRTDQLVASSGDGGVAKLVIMLGRYKHSEA